MSHAPSPSRHAQSIVLPNPSPIQSIGPHAPPIPPTQFGGPSMTHAVPPTQFGGPSMPTAVPPTQFGGPTTAPAAIQKPFAGAESAAGFSTSIFPIFQIH
jgi:hypothetical protein